MNRKISIAVVNYLIVIAAIVISSISFLDVPLAKTFISYSGFYLTLILFLLWVSTLIRNFIISRPNVVDFIKSNAVGIVVSIALSTIIFTSVQPLFRVLSDETNLVSVSKSMLYERRADNVSMGRWYYDNFYQLGRETEKRPLIFPFFIYLVHLVLGYSPHNAFVLNYLVLTTILFLLYKIGKRFWGAIGGVSGIILVAAQPIVAQTATSAGFDLFFVLFLILSFLTLQWFLKERTGLRFELLWLTLLMLSSSRYEGIMSFAIVMAFLLSFKYIKRALFASGFGFTFSMTPLLFLPYIWERIIVKDTFQTQGVAFSIDYFLKHNKVFLSSLIDYKFILPYATVISFIGFVGLFYLVLRHLSSGKAEDRHLAIISAVCVAANWALYTSYYAGSPNHPSSCRFYVLFYVILSLIAAAVVWRISVSVKKPVIILWFAVIMFMIYHPVAIEDRFSRTQLTPRTYRFVMEVLQKEAKKGRDFIVITDRPGQYTVHNYGAVSFNYANESLRDILTGFHNHLYNRIFVVQDIYYKGRVVKDDMVLPDHIQERLMTVAELQNDAEYFVRISQYKPVLEIQDVRAGRPRPYGDS